MRRGEDEGDGGRERGREEGGWARRLQGGDGGRGRERLGGMVAPVKVKETVNGSRSGNAGSQ